MVKIDNVVFGKKLNMLKKFTIDTQQMETDRNISPD